MPRLMVPILACALGVGAAFALVSCGGGDDEGLLPGSTASEIVSNIDQAQSALAAEDCDKVIEYAGEIRSQVEGLPATVDQDLRGSLRKGADRLLDLAGEDNCGLADPEGSTTESTTTEESTEETSTKETTETDESTETKETTTVPTEPTTTTTTPPTTVPPTTTEPPTTVPTTPPETTPPSGGGVGPGGGIGPAGRQAGT